MRVYQLITMFSNKELKSPIEIGLVPKLTAYKKSEVNNVIYNKLIIYVMCETPCKSTTRNDASYFYGK